MTALRQTLRAFFAAGFRPWPVAAWEWTTLRALFLLLLADDLLDPANFRYASLEEPHGIAAWLHGTPLELTFLARAGAREGLLAVAAVAGLLYLLVPLRVGWQRRWSLLFPLATTVLAVAHIAVRTVQNSQGSIHHSHQVIGLVLLGQAILGWTLWARRRRPLPAAPAAGSVPSLFAWYSLGVLASSYVVAGLSKLFNSKGLWVWNAPWISFDLIKSQRQAYYKKLEPIYLGGTELAEWVLAHPWLARLCGGGAFMLELAAILALKNRAWAFWIGLGLISLHLGIWLLMHLEFQANFWCLLIFLVLPGVLEVTRRGKRRTRQG